MARHIFAGRVAFSHADFIESGNRKSGIEWLDVEAKVFFNGEILPWPISDGSNTPDSSIGSGVIYFNEVVGAVGFYLVRFFPDKTGFWRVVLKHSETKEVTLEFDVSSSTQFSSGLLASFGP